jgi:hypothetical protein
MAIGILRQGRFGGFLDISRRSIRQLADFANANSQKKYVREATREAIKETVAQLRSGYAYKEMARETGIPESVIKKLARTKFSNKRDYVRVWFGLNPVNLKDLKPKQDASGVTAGPARVPNGFIAKGNFKGKGQVFKRKGMARLPIQKQVYNVESKGWESAKTVYNHLLKSFEDRLPDMIESRLRQKGFI